MKLKQLVSRTTRPVSNTCLDHIHTSNPQRIQNIVCPNIGLSDHLPVFAVRLFSVITNVIINKRVTPISSIAKWRILTRNSLNLPSKKPHGTRYLFFVFDDIDDKLSSWESLFNSALDSNCPWRVKRVAKAKKSPRLDSSVIKQLRKRDRLLKIAKR